MRHLGKSILSEFQAATGLKRVHQEVAPLSSMVDATWCRLASAHMNAECPSKKSSCELGVRRLRKRFAKTPDAHAYGATVYL
jgi:hypothetical protein